MRRRDQQQQLDPEEEAAAPDAAVAEPAQPVKRDRAPANMLALQRTAGNAAVGRMLGRLLQNNPPDVTDATGAATTMWAAPTIADAVNQRGQTHVATPQAVTPLPTPIAVKPKATAAAPLVKDTATAAELFDQEPSNALPPGTAGPTQPQSPGFDVVTHQQGSDATPIVDPVADNSLFIDPGPKPLDVHQAGIGDCYALATIIAIANRDPGKIRSMMAPDGSGGATVTLYKRLAHAPGFFGFFSGPTYEPEQVQVSAELAFRRSAPGAPTRATRSSTGDTRFGYRLYGAQLHVADTPKERHWWVDVRNGVLEVHREDVFQMARWAPLLEKAIARFSQTYGQYGHGQQISGEGEKLGPSGLQNISGGWSGHTLTMFYGKAAEVVSGGNGDEIGTSWSAGQGATSLLLSNSAAFDRLLTLQGRGATHQTGDTTAPIVTATTGVGESGKRLYATRMQSAFPAAMAASDWGSLSPGAQAKINAAFGWTTAWIGAGPDAPKTTPPTPPAPNTKSWAFNFWQQACQTAASDPEITNPARSNEIKALLDLMLIIQNMPNDTGGGTRSVYANHVYSVLAVDIRSTGGGASDIHTKPAMLRPFFYSTVDVQGSTVTLMNPHHANAPEATPGAANAPGTADPTTGLTPAQSGQFTVSLERFFRLYGSVMSNEFTIPAY